MSQSLPLDPVSTVIGDVSLYNLDLLRRFSHILTYLEPAATALPLRDRRSWAERLCRGRVAIYLAARDQQADSSTRGRARRSDLHSPGQAPPDADRGRRGHRRIGTAGAAGAQQSAPHRRRVPERGYRHARHRYHAPPGAVRAAAGAEALCRALSEGALVVASGRS